MIDDWAYACLVNAAKFDLPNLAKRDSYGNFLRFANEIEIVSAAMDACERRYTQYVFGSLTFDDLTSDDVKAIIDGYCETHITAATGL